MRKTKTRPAGPTYFIPIAFLAVMAFLCAACSIPLEDKSTTDAVKPVKGEVVQETDVKPGDIKVVDGVEYIYARNMKFQFTPYEPEYMWVRKDRYEPGAWESMMLERRRANDELEARMAKLEARVRGGGPEIEHRQAAGPPRRPTSDAASYVAPTLPRPAVRADLRLKRRVLVLPVVDAANAVQLHLGELATRKLTAMLEESGGVIAVDASQVALTQGGSSAGDMELLELHGIQAAVKVTLTTFSDGAPPRADGDAPRFKLSVVIFNTDTGALFGHSSAHTPVLLQKGAGSTGEAAWAGAISFAVEQIGRDIVKGLQSLDWRARVAFVESGRVVINAGRSSGLRQGDTLDVYAVGEQVVDRTTRVPLGRMKGHYRGEIEVNELFGIDAARATIRKGATFSTTDLVYLKEGT